MIDYKIIKLWGNFLKKKYLEKRKKFKIGKRIKGIIIRRVDLIWICI